MLWKIATYMETLTHFYHWVPPLTRIPLEYRSALIIHIESIIEAIFDIVVQNGDYVKTKNTYIN